MRNIKLYFFLLLFLNQPVLSLAQVEFKITPPITEVTLGRGGTKVFLLEISNLNKEKTMEFLIYPADIDTDRGGGIEFLQIGESPYSCSKWIKVEPDKVSLRPGQTKKIISKLSLPAVVLSGGYYSAIICELVSKQLVKSESGSIIKWRIASLVKASVLGGKIEKKLELEDIYLRTLFEKKEENKGITFIASLKNTGNIHVQAEGKLTILTPDRKRKGEIALDVGTGTILPGHIRDFSVVYDRFIPEGEYIARVTFRYGGSASLEKEIPFSVTAEKGINQNGVVSIPSFKVIPQEIKFKLPAGAFRITGLSIQNQRLDKLKIKMALDTESNIHNWISFEPQELLIAGGREKKVILRCNIPQWTDEGVYKAKIILMPSLINEYGQEESLDSENVEVVFEIPEF